MAPEVTSRTLSISWVNALVMSGRGGCSHLHGVLRHFPSIWCLQMTLWIHRLYCFSPSLQGRLAMESQGS